MTKDNDKMISQIWEENIKISCELERIWYFVQISFWILCLMGGYMAGEIIASILNILG